MVADYYAMLGVDPGADRAALEAALAKMPAGLVVGDAEPEDQAHVPVVPRPDPRDPAGPARRPDGPGGLRRRAADAARRAERDRKLDELQRLVRLRAAKGGLTVADRTCSASRPGSSG